MAFVSLLLQDRRQAQLNLIQFVELRFEWNCN